MPFTNPDVLTVAGILSTLAAENLQALEADLAWLIRRYPNLPWRDIVSAMGGGVGSTTTPGNFRIQDGLTASLAVVGLAANFSAVSSPLLGVADVGGVSNPAVFDTTGAPNTAVNTGIIDVSAWRSLFIFAITSAAPTAALQINMVDDAGADFRLANATLGPIDFDFFFGWGLGAGTPGTNLVPAGDTGQLPFPLPRRIRLLLPAQGGVVTGRVGVVGRR